jgi:hypothetical protein
MDATPLGLLMAGALEALEFKGTTLLMGHLDQVS